MLGDRVVVAIGVGDVDVARNVVWVVVVVAVVAPLVVGVGDRLGVK